MGREESHGVAGVEDEGLVLLHNGQVVHEKPELSPVGQHLTITTIGYQLLRKLCVSEREDREGGRGEGKGEKEREKGGEREQKRRGKENIASSQRHFQAKKLRKA